jgi:cytoskeletal protein CcmA (bactofilin family)
MRIKSRVPTDRFRRSPRHLFVFAVLLVAAPAGSATADQDEFREFMGRDLVAAGNQVTVSGEDLGGAFAAGETVELASPTREDALLAGRYVRVRAAVGDDAYLAGELVEVDAPVAGRIVAAGETVSLNSGAETGGGVRLFGRRVEVAGTVGGDAWIAAETVRLSGKFSGDVTVSARNVEVAPNARFDGMLITRAPEEPAVPQTAVPPDRWRYEKWEPPEWEGGWAPWQFTGVIFGAILLFPLSLLVTGAILLAVAGRTMDRIASTGAERPAASIGGGLIVLAVWGVAALLLLFTIIGAPLGVLLGLALPLLIMLGYVAGALVLALGAWRSLGKAPPGGLGRFGLLAVSLFVLSAVGLIPVVGFIAGLLVTLAGLGATFIVLREDRPSSGHHQTAGM